MGYKLIISDEAKRELDNIISYVVSRLYNPDAAVSILDSINQAYQDIESFPEAWSVCNDVYLADKGYRKYLLADHNYVIIYRISGEFLRISVFFRVRENYSKKL